MQKWASIEIVAYICEIQQTNEGSIWIEQDKCMQFEGDLINYKLQSFRSSTS